MAFTRRYFLLFVTLLLAAVLRFWDLPNNPPGLTWDEAALGYNAYSILQTGRDEYGNVLPINLKSFGDFKPALYAYLIVPSAAAFGLNEFAVRFPSVIFGILGVLGIYLLTQELFKNRWLSISAAFFLAINPWHMQFSRPAFEANVALFLNTLGTYLFLKGLTQNKWFILSATSFGLSIFTYQGSRIFVPLMVLILTFIFRERVKDMLKKWEIKISVGLLVGAFLTFFFTTFLLGQTGRLATINFFAYQRSIDQLKIISEEDGLPIDGASFQILHGEWWAYTKGLFERYLIYFSPKMLFIEGDYSPRHRVPDLGALYYFSLVLLPVGLIHLIKLQGQSSKLLLFWLLVAPIPAVLSRDLISILRALNLVIPFSVLEATGLFWILSYTWGRGTRFFYLLTCAVAIIIAFNFLIYLDRYFIHAPKEYSKYWLYGYKEILQDFDNLKAKYDRIVVSDEFGQPYIYYLFYTKYSPLDFQKQVVLDQPTVDVGTVRKIDNIEFRHVFWPKDRGLKNSLFIGTLEELPDKDIIPFPEYRILKEVKFLNGETAFRMVESQ